MAEPVHLAVPLTRAAGGMLATVEQGSAADEDQRIFATLNTPLGWLTHLPEFGRPGLAFLRTAVTLHEVERVLAMWVTDVDLVALRDSGRIGELAEDRDVLTVKEAE